MLFNLLYFIEIYKYEIYIYFLDYEFFEGKYFILFNMKILSKGFF